MIPATPARPDSTSSVDRGFLSVSLPMVLTVLVLLGLTLAIIWVLSSLRAYAYGEGLYSKAERQTIITLQQYASSGQNADYRQLRQELTILADLHVVREAQQRPAPDFDLARSKLVESGNNAADAPDMVRLFRLARALSSHALPAVAHVVELWTGGDPYLARIDQVAEQLHGLIERGNPDPEQVKELLAQAQDLHARVVPLEDEFAATLNDASRETAWLLAVMVTLSAVSLAVIGLLIMRASLQRGKRVASEYAARLSYQATHDALTGLHNRVEFETRLREAIGQRGRDGTLFALMYFDLDQLKVVNDICGHMAGDDLIRQVAWLARGKVSDGDVLARLGGDEFGVLVRDCTPDRALHLAGRLCEDVAGLRFRWKDRVFAVSISIGVASLDETLLNVEEALVAVDQACYVAKGNGRNRVHLYLPDDHQTQAMRGEMHWVERLHAALDGDQFSLMAQEIQPIGQRAGQGTLVTPHRHFELLLRLTDADGHPAAPMGFIPAAERYGLMSRIDRWVIARACRELGELRTRGIGLPTCMINLSATSVSDPDLADYIVSCLGEHGIAGVHVGFELTETAAIGNLGNAARLFTRLRELGCPIALDDFGSGMASFAYLKTLPIDYVKIDGGFIRDIRSDPVDFALVEAVQRIGDALGFRTVAEWVESQPVLDALTRIGVDFAQGFYIHRPEPLAQIMSRVAA